MNETSGDPSCSSTEVVALKLFELIRASEKGQDEKPTRKWILDTYSECLLAVKTPNARRSAEKY